VGAKVDGSQIHRRLPRITVTGLAKRDRNKPVAIEIYEGRDGDFSAIRQEGDGF
jgi:hypothetical protein